MDFETFPVATSWEQYSDAFNVSQLPVEIQSFVKYTYYAGYFTGVKTLASVANSTTMPKSQREEIINSMEHELNTFDTLARMNVF